MNAEGIMGLVIISLVACAMIAIGLFQASRKNAPVGFYTGAVPPRKEEIKDVIKWNREHGAIFIIYGICIELGFWLGYAAPGDALKALFLIGGIVVPLPFMVIRHNQLEKEYRKK